MVDYAKAIANGNALQNANFNISGMGAIGADLTVGGNATVKGNLNVTGLVFNGNASTGYIPAPFWAYSAIGPSNAWQPLWNGIINVPRKSTVALSLNGHWNISNAWCYATLLVDGVGVAEPTCSNANTQCWGAAHTYVAQWQPITYTVYVTLDAGAHTVGPGVVTQSGATCYMNGARIFYSITPQ